MAITDFLIGEKGVRRQRDRAIDFAMDRYDPNVFQPQVDLFSKRADEGLDESVEQSARNRTVESLFRPRDRSVYGSQGSRAISGSQQEGAQQQQQLGQFERGLTEADIQAQQAGERGLAEAQTKQMQMESQQQAAIREAELQYETELQRRKQQLASKVGQMAGTVAGLAGAGPLASAAIGGAGGFLGSGGQAGGAFSGATTGALTAYQVGQDAEGTPEQQTPEDSLLLAQNETAGIEARGMESEMPEMKSRGIDALPFGDNVVQDTPTPTPKQQPASNNQGVDMNAMGYDEGGRRTGASTPTTGTVNDLTQLLDTPDYLNQVNFEDDGQPTRKPRQRLGDQLFDDADYMRHLLGPVGEGIYNFGTFPFREGLNFWDQFDEEYGRTLEEGHEMKGERETEGFFLFN